MRFVPRSTALRVGGLAVAMVVVAEVAVWALGPREDLPEPAEVRAGDYFDPGQLERAEEYRSGQRALMIGGLVIEGALLLTVALGRPRRVHRAIGRLGARPVLGAAAVGGALALAASAVTLPTRVAAHERAVDYGLSTQSLSSWGWDVARAAGITAVLTAGGTAVLIALVRRFPRDWWLPGAAGVAGIAVVFTWVAPVVLAPIFNDFDPLPDGSRARADVLALGKRAGVEIGEVYSVDASRRVRTLNAYVDGLGSTKRVVIYDNLLEDAERRELNSIVAHELAHVAHSDIPRGIAFVALVAPLGLLFVRELVAALTARSGVQPGTPGAVPAYLLALSLAGFAIGIPANQLSREVEASADSYALELTRDPQALIDVQLRLAETNLSDPEPPGLVTALFGTHPPTLERIGAAIAHEGETSGTAPGGGESSDD
jgi:STE24 endopeptidase